MKTKREQTHEEENKMKHVNKTKQGIKNREGRNNGIQNIKKMKSVKNQNY